MAVTRRGELEPAFVLHRRPYRDTSALVEFITATHGRVGAVARGVQRARSRQAGLLQPFQPLRISWQARGELATLTGVESAGRPVTLAGTRMVSGFYANELMIRLVAREDPQPDLFAAYQAVLSRLGSSGAEGPPLRVFERDLLAASGYGLLLDRDAGGHPVEAGQWYRYDAEHGPEPVAEPRGPGVRLPGEALLALAAGEPDARADRWLKRLMRATLSLYLGDRPLKSRELYARYRRTPNAGDPDHDDE